MARQSERIEHRIDKLGFFYALERDNIRKIFIGFGGTGQCRVELYNSKDEFESGKAPYKIRTYVNDIGSSGEKLHFNSYKTIYSRFEALEVPLIIYSHIEWDDGGFFPFNLQKTKRQTTEKNIVFNKETITTNLKLSLDETTSEALSVGWYIFVCYVNGSSEWLKFSSSSDAEDAEQELALNDAVDSWTEPWYYGSRPQGNAFECNP